MDEMQIKLCPFGKDQNFNSIFIVIFEYYSVANFQYLQNRNAIEWSPIDRWKMYAVNFVYFDICQGEKPKRT